MNSPDKNTFWPAAKTLWHRECTRFFRQRSRVIGAFVTPVLFWVLIGSGIGTSLQGSTAGEDTANYLEFFVPGTSIMIVLFTAIFSSFSLIESRREGFLQAVLVAPVPRSSIALGTILGGTSLAFLQGSFFLLIGMIYPIIQGEMSHFTVFHFMFIVTVMLITSFELTALGFIFAWRSESTSGFHSIMNMLFLPMWFLSGALFPISGAFTWVQWLMWANPLSYSVSALRHGLYNQPSVTPDGMWCLLVSFLSTAVLFFLASRTVHRTGFSES